MDAPDVIDWLISVKPTLPPALIKKLEMAFSAPLPESTSNNDTLHQIARDQLAWLIRQRDTAFSTGDDSAAAWSQQLNRQLTTLARLESQLYNQHRLQAVEMATIETLKEFPGLHEKFLENLEKRLE